MAKQKSLLPESNPSVYRDLSVPFENPDVANDAVQNFVEELYALRAKYRMRDVLVVVQVPIKYDDGTEGTPIAHAMLGDPFRAEMMAAYALGRTGSDRQQLVASAVDDSIRGLKAPQSRK